MINAAVTGWGKCLPPAILSNGDLTQLFDTTDEWITTRTGIHERRISHVSARRDGVRRVRARAGLRRESTGSAIDLIIFGTCSHDDQVPNLASGIQVRIGAHDAASMDVNTACTSFLYGLSTATAMIRTGVVRNALVIGAELISPFMDWNDRNVAVLFGDGAAAVVLQATDRQEGLLAEKLGCYGDAREILRVQGMGGRYANQGVLFGVTHWQFEGQEIFKRAVHGMGAACESALGEDRASPGPGRSRGAAPGEPAHHRGGGEARARADGAVYVNVQRYGNMSSATVPVALCEALEEGRVKPGALLLMPGFGGGLTYCAHAVRWGERVTPLGTLACGASAERPHGARDHPRPANAQARAGQHRDDLVALTRAVIALRSYFLRGRFLLLGAGSFGRDLPNEPL